MTSLLKLPCLPYVGSYDQAVPMALSNVGLWGPTQSPTSQFFQKIVGYTRVWGALYPHMLLPSPNTWAYTSANRSI